MSIQSRTKEEIYRYFQDCGCTLLEDYRTATYKMKYICKCGRESKISWNKFLGGRRCGFCDPTGRKKKLKSFLVKEDAFYWLSLMTITDRLFCIDVSATM